MKGCKDKNELNCLNLNVKKQHLNIVSMYFQSLNPISFKYVGLFRQFFFIFTHKWISVGI